MVGLLATVTPLTLLMARLARLAASSDPLVCAALPLYSSVELVP